MSENTIVKKPDWLNEKEDGLISDMGVGSMPRVKLTAGGALVLKTDSAGDVVWPANTPIIILKTYPRPQYVNYRTYWESRYDPSRGTPPTCCSNNGIVPNSWANKPQAEACDRCPRNEPGTGGTEKARACRSTKQILIIKGDDPNGVQAVFSVPCTAIKGLYRYYSEVVRRFNVGESEVLTTITVDPETTNYVKPQFQFVDYIRDKEVRDFCVATHKQLNDSEAEFLQLTNLNDSIDDVQYPLPAPALPAPTKQAPIDLTLLGLPPVSGQSRIHSLLDSLAKITCQDALEAYYASETVQENYAACTAEEQAEFITAARQRFNELSQQCATPAAASPQSPSPAVTPPVPPGVATDVIRQKLAAVKVLPSSEALVAILEAIKDTDHAEDYRDDFIAACELVNGEPFDPDKHATTRSPGKYPALTKTGGYKKRRNTSETPPATSGTPPLPTSNQPAAPPLPTSNQPAAPPLPTSNQPAVSTRTSVAVAQAKSLLDLLQPK